MLESAQKMSAEQWEAFYAYMLVQLEPLGFDEMLRDALHQWRGANV